MYLKRIKKKTEFGIELAMFLARNNMTIKEVSEKAGVKYSTLVETTTGRCAGHDLIPIVREFMREYEKEA